MTMRIRLEGNRAELTLGMVHLRQFFTVTSMSRAFPARNRPRHYRIYLTITPRQSR
ncbi:hypothetical protein [Nonomuraea basaltis]|uniref:hypothetical protein n=1 Tax=Nonomuraea basaltis TaxID=2495887 RepID=UPI0014860A7E|nr:hypothetical protein [Nonomuraea basaltis]